MWKYFISVGLVYNNDMLKHSSRTTIDYGRHHPERPERILKPLERFGVTAIKSFQLINNGHLYFRLNETDTLSKVYLMRGREATQEEIYTMHLECRPMFLYCN